MATARHAISTQRRYFGYEVLGRLLMAVRASALADTRMDYWIAGDGGVVLEWAHGPTAHEARQVLLDGAVASGGPDVVPEDLVRHPDRPDVTTDGRVHALMRGVEVQFRGRHPIGMRAAPDRVRDAVGTAEAARAGRHALNPDTGSGAARRSR